MRLVSAQSSSCSIRSRLHQSFVGGSAHPREFLVDLPQLCCLMLADPTRRHQLRQEAKTIVKDKRKFVRYRAERWHRVYLIMVRRSDKHQRLNQPIELFNWFNRFDLGQIRQKPSPRPSKTSRIAEFPSRRPSRPLHNPLMRPDLRRQPRPNRSAHQIAKPIHKRVRHVVDHLAPAPRPRNQVCVCKHS